MSRLGINMVYRIAADIARLEEQRDASAVRIEQATWKLEELRSGGMTSAPEAFARDEMNTQEWESPAVVALGYPEKDELGTHRPEDSFVPPEPATVGGVAAVPRLAEGIDFMGEYKGCGFKETPYLVRRADGQVVHLSRLLYLVAEAVDGRRDYEQIAGWASWEFGRDVSAENIRFLVEKKLRPLGVLAPAEGETIEPPRLKESLLGLKYRLGVVPAGLVRAITLPFLLLFWPPVVAAVLVALVALDIWLFSTHGVTDGLREVIYAPSLALLFVVVEMAAMAWHELGHATACRYGGAKPGKVGVGIYIVWFVFYSDVTDSYRLDKKGRLRVDCGGIYFDAIFTLGLAGLYFLTGFEPLLVLIVFNQLASLDEFSPFLRFDGYYILTDLTGVPDLFRTIKPVLKSLIPGRGADEVKVLKPWVRVVITVWVLAVVPFLLIGLVMLVYWGPWVIANAWNSFFVNYGEVSSAFAEGRIIEGLIGLVDVVALVVPVVGGTLIFAWVSRRFVAAAWRWSEGRPLQRAGFGTATAAAAAIMLFAWWPDTHHEQQPDPPSESFTARSAAAPPSAPPTTATLRPVGPDPAALEPTPNELPGPVGPDPAPPELTPNELAPVPMPESEPILEPILEPMPESEPMPVVGEP